MQIAGAVVSDVVARADIRQRAHDHDRPFLCFVLAGRYEERVAGRARTWHPSSVLLHAESTRHADHLPAGGRLFGVTLGPRWDAPLAALPRFDGVLAAPTGDSSWLLARVRQEVATALPCAGLAVEGLLLEVVASLARSCDDGGHAAVARAADLMRAAPHRPLSVAAVAREVGLAPETLARRFREVHGMSLTSYHRRLRVEEACRHIAAGEALSDVAAAAGFADQSHLTRVFRRVTGTTPAAWRRNSR